MHRIVIIGGGFSGTLTAVHILRRARAAPARPQLHVTLIEREPRRRARGYAYSTPHPACLLNVPAGRMSALPDDVDHFVRWSTRRDAAVGGGAFVPRGMYGEYLADLLHEAASTSTTAGVHFEHITGEASAVDESAVTLRDGRRLEADRIVLALGNFPPCDPPGADESVLRGRGYTRNPWEPDALSNVARSLDGGGGDVLLIGTGLTMYDVALVLRDAGFRGTIQAISRRGLVPQPHRVSAAPPPHLPMPQSMRMANPTPVKLLRALRREVRESAQAGVDWREVVTALRDDTPALWQALDERGRRQFLRHLLPIWETHRHRAAPQTAARVQRLRDEGQLIVRAARLLRIEPSGDEASLTVTLRPRGASFTETLRVAHVINCTGPDTNLLRCGGALLAQLIADNLVTPDALGLGLRTAADGALLRPDGSPSPSLFTLGPLRKGDLWETTAVPELRVQASTLAQRLLG